MIGFISLGEFLEDQQLAAKFSAERGVPYNEALRAANAYRKQKNADAASKASDLPPELLAAAGQNTVFPKQAGTRLGDMLRSNMPQVSADEVVANKDIPTGKLEFVKPSELKYTQSELNQTKVKAMVNDWENVGKKPVLISNNNWVLDGHHRVAAAAKKGKLVRVIRIDLPGKTALRKLQELQDVVK